MATASYRLYAAAIAQRLGFDDVIATETLSDRKGRIVARIDGRNCYGLAKLDMIEAWLQRVGLERDAVHIRFYSDHISDAPVHHWSDEAFATNAHARLIASPRRKAGKSSTGATASARSAELLPELVGLLQPPPERAAKARRAASTSAAD